MNIKGNKNSEQLKKSGMAQRELMIPYYQINIFLLQGRDDDRVFPHDTR